jgi:hypothetical protein
MKSESTFSKMHTIGLIVEHRHTSVALSVDLASYMSRQHSKGTIAVAANHPQALMSSVRKQWLRLIRLAQRERASTLSRQCKESLDEIICSMQAISFTAKDPTHDSSAYVSFATTERFVAAPPMCATLYIIQPVTKSELYLLASWMRPGSMVVIYDR